MVQQKLYTEEQVLKMLEVCRDTDLYEHILTFEDILKTEIPIELPSDEEIRKRAEEGDDDDLSAADEYERGAKWMKEQILNQNK